MHLEHSRILGHWILGHSGLYVHSGLLGHSGLYRLLGHSRLYEHSGILGHSGLYGHSGPLENLFNGQPVNKLPIKLCKLLPGISFSSPEDFV